MKLTEEMKELVKTELAYIATADNEGNPNVGPKRTMRVLDDTHLIFCENTDGKHHANIKANGKISVTFIQREKNFGFRFDGIAKSYTDEEHMELAKKKPVYVRKLQQLLLKLKQFIQWHPVLKQENYT